MMFLRTLILALVCALLLNGCAALDPPAALETDSADEIVATLEEAAELTGTDPTATASADTAEVADKLAQVDGEGSAVAAASEVIESIPVEPDFDLAVDKVPVNAFFQALVADTPYNVLVHPGVKGTVSLNLNDVTVSQVMELMRSVYGYDSVLTGNTYQIYPDALRTEIFQVDYLNVTRTGHSEMQVSAGKVTDAAGSNNGNATNGNNTSNGNNQNNNSGGSVVGTMVNTDGTSEFWVELDYTLQAVIAGDEGAQVMVTPQVGLVVVRAKPDSLAAVRAYLAKVQNSLHRQVILEAKILEVTLKEGFQAGIDWNTFGDASGGTFEPSTIVDSNGLVVTTLGSEHRAAGQLRSGEGADVFNPTGAAFSLFGAFGDFSAVIDLLQSQGVVQVLSSPRIATVNNQKAVIKVGDDEFFVTDINVNTVTAGAAINTNDSPELTPFFSGIALDVTPQISEAGDVILHVHPTVSEVREQIKVISGEPVPLAASTIRESDSVIRARNGQVVVIGGLMQNSSTDNNGEVPGLGSLPLAGNLFRQRVSASTKSELVILLRPMVVNSGSQAPFLRNSADRVSGLRREIGGAR